MDALLDGAPCGFLSFADDGTVLRINRTLLDMLGHAHDDLVGGPIEKIFTVGTRIFYQTHFFPLVRMHGQAEEIFLILRCADGTDAGVLTNVARRETADGYVNDCVFMRVRERQKFEAELVRARRETEDALAALQGTQHQLLEANAELEQQATELEVTSEELLSLNGVLEDRMVEVERLREAAEEANRAKSEFLAMMSHELRTPLNAIAGYSQLMEMGVQGPVTESQVESLQRIQQSQRHLLRLVNEILNLARIESGIVTYDLQEVSVTELVARILPLVEPQMAEKKITRSIDVPDQLMILCDIDKTQQILINLLSNAIKFTAPGGTISIQAEPDPGNRDCIAIAVADSGIGIPEDLLETIFDPFVQVESNPSRRGEGTGLGLAISRDLAQGMNGRLTATSVAGEGSTFHLRLPAVASSQAGALQSTTA